MTAIFVSGEGISLRKALDSYNVRRTTTCAAALSARSLSPFRKGTYVPKFFSRRKVASALTIPLVITGLAVLTPGVAEAATCGQSWTDRDKGGSGMGVGSSSDPWMIYVRTGIYADCPWTSKVSTSTKLYYHCYRRNSYGNSWTHVRVEGSGTLGWVYDGNLNNYGSIYAC